MHDPKTAIALIGADRLTYYRRTIQSLAKNSAAQVYPVFAFLDYPVVDQWGSDPKKVQEDHARVTLEHFPDAQVILRDANFGCGRNIIDARRHLFDILEYKQVFVIEDDMILSSSYLQYCLNLMMWANSNYSNIGVVQGWNKCFYSSAEKQKHLREVHPTVTNWWGYLMDSQCWNSIRDEIYEYEKQWLPPDADYDYLHRPHIEIAHWIKERVKPFEVISKGLSPTEAWLYYSNKFWASPATGQDAATMLALNNAGLLRLAPTVNRGLYIGKHGVHMNPNWFVRDRFNEIELHEFKEDLRYQPFILEVLPDCPPKEIVEGMVGKGV